MDDVKSSDLIPNGRVPLFMREDWMGRPRVTLRLNLLLEERDRLWMRFLVGEGVYWHFGNQFPTTTSTRHSIWGLINSEGATNS